MPARVSESIVLRTYPLREADLIVSFFARDQGRLRGVARRARRFKNTFGSGLERLSHVEMQYFYRENRELLNLDSCELIQSQFALAQDYAASVALDYIAEVSEQLLPPAEPNEKFFRLLLAVLNHLRETGALGIWPATTYFGLWAVRLSGFLPELKLPREELAIAEEMLQKPIGALAGRQWNRQSTGALRRLLNRAIEGHIERELETAAYLNTL